MARRRRRFEEKAGGLAGGCIGHLNGNSGALSGLHHATAGGSKLFLDVITTLELLFRQFGLCIELVPLIVQRPQLDVFYDNEDAWNVDNIGETLNKHFEGRTPVTDGYSVPPQ